MSEGISLKSREEQGGACLCTTSIPDISLESNSAHVQIVQKSFGWAVIEVPFAYT